MLAEFERPNVVVCILCKGTVSVRKGDKTRFFNHISIDHEVHFDLDLFYAISFMSDTEKTKIIQLLATFVQLRLQKETKSDEVENLEQANHYATSVVSENMEQTHSGTNTSAAENIEKTHPETITDVTENMEQAPPNSETGDEENIIVHINPETVLEINSNDEDSEEERECAIDGSINADETDDSALPISSPLTSEKPIEIMTELVPFAPPKREKCRKCSKMILSKQLRIHMKTKHSKQICCRICSNFIFKSNFRRHMLEVHTDFKDCEFCEQMVRIFYMEKHLKKEHAIDRACHLKLNSSPEDTGAVFIKQEIPETSEQTLEEIMWKKSLYTFD